MRLLIDTHAFMWFVGGSEHLSANARAAIEDVANDRYLSIASTWEMAVKMRLGKLILSSPLDEYLGEHLDRSMTTIASITLQHVALIATLPLHHRDPFDRMLIAQAITEGMPIVSADKAFDAYPITRIW